ncbi:MAG: heme transporter CcmC [Candidatus Nitrosocosmicus sp.]
MAFSSRTKLIIFILGSIAAIGISSVLQIVYAQESGATVFRRVEIWGLFYRGMIAAFMVGAAVMGVWIYVSYRFRESHKRFRVSDSSTGVKTGGNR